MPQCFEPIIVAGIIIFFSRASRGRSASICFFLRFALGGAKNRPIPTRFLGDIVYRRASCGGLVTYFFLSQNGPDVMAVAVRGACSVSANFIRRRRRRSCCFRRFRLRPLRPLRRLSCRCHRCRRRRCRSIMRQCTPGVS